MTGEAPQGRRFNGSWWARHMVRATALAQLKTYEECVLDRILRSFDRLGDEMDEMYKRLLNQVDVPPDGYLPSGAEEWAGDKASEWGAGVGAVYTGTIGLLTVGLFHLFEQHRDMFFREAHRIEARAYPDLAAWLSSVGVDLEAFPRWETLNRELREVANVVKHAEGRAARTLRTLRPDLFEFPGNRDSDRRPFGLDLPVEGPLTGEGIYLTEEDFKSYADLVREFWEWLAAELERATEARP